jgi:polyhydroxyalkanoate synthase
VSHKSGSPATADTPKQEHESEAQEIASAREQHFYAPTALGEVVDRAARAALARFTLGFSPAALAECYLDFATHLASSPGKQLQLLQKAVQQFARLAHHAREYAARASETEPFIHPLPQDRRFVGEPWQQWPYNLIIRAFCCSSSGGIAPQQVCAASPNSMRKPLSLLQDRYSMFLHRPIFF